MQRGSIFGASTTSPSDDATDFLTKRKPDGSCQGHILVPKELLAPMLYDVGVLFLSKRDSDKNEARCLSSLGSAFEICTSNIILKMSTKSVLLAGLQLLVVVCSAQKNEFFWWNTPRAAGLEGPSLDRRQTTPPGYHPEFGSCGSGTTCENACGANWLSCRASTELSLFCYNQVDLGQSCCENGSGRACDRGYYCAWKELGGRVWCCEDGQSLEECGVGGGTTSAPPSSSTATTSAGPSGSTDTTTTPTDTESDFPTATDSQCVPSTVTSWGTTTVVSTFEVTVTVGTGECNTASTVTSPPDSSSWTDTTITKPPTSQTTHRPTNSTTMSPIVTAGSSDLRVNLNSLALFVLGVMLY
ncbi:hypothetical protein QC761_302130 [Podospora bellae-mahoneyi]|uniref:Uncharacterized protein n=1 Tax=Podospora bellae-mahoneyi TaxID=2093777 RepID=A0ABR0FJP1_9PEZI|nr:hypothetical protein QC761_302130 [Podospora bellae-mahoneyi]